VEQEVATTETAAPDAGGLFGGMHVPPELLRTAIARTKADVRVADVSLMAGVDSTSARSGRAAKAAALWSVLQTSGFAPIALITLAAIVAGTVDTGVAILAPNIEKTFHLNDAALGAVAFASSAAPFILGIPLALWGDRGRRTAASAVAMLVWALAVPFMGLAPSVWVFVAFAVVSGFGRAAPNSVHLSYLSDVYPVESRARILAIQRSSDPIARTLGAATMGAIATLAGGNDGWRWAMSIALVGFPLALAISRLREPEKGAHERRHVLAASGLRDAEADSGAPRVLLGTAIQRLLRIRSLYYQFIAIAVLGFAAVGIPLFGSLYLKRVWGLSTGQRAEVYLIIGFAAFLGLPAAGLVGDRLYRRSPELPLLLGGGSLAAFGVIYASSLYLPHLWMVVAGFFLAEACLAPLATAILQTVAATAPAELRSLTFALFGIYSLFFGGFLGGVVLGAISDAQGPRFALTLMGPVTIAGGLLLAIGSRHVKRDITLAIEDILEDHQERNRRASGGAVHALQVHHVDFAYETQQVLFDVTFDVAEGETCALLGTNGAGKSTLLRLIAGLDHANRGVIRLFGVNSTYLEAEQVMALGVSMVPGGRATFPSLSVEENLRAGSFAFRREARLRRGLDDVYEAFPVLAARRQQRAGTLSGGEQQMLTLGRAMIHRPRLLLVDELTLGLAPKVVEVLLGIVREMAAAGTTVVLVEQSVNLALTLADRALFLERGELRYDGPTLGLLSRDDLLRPIFLGATLRPPAR